MTNKRLAILGAGNMGRALIGGLLRSGTRPEHISVGAADLDLTGSWERNGGAEGEGEPLIDGQVVLVRETDG